MSPEHISNGINPQTTVICQAELGNMKLRKKTVGHPQRWGLKQYTLTMQSKPQAEQPECCNQGFRLTNKDSKTAMDSENPDSLAGKIYSGIFQLLQKKIFSKYNQWGKTVIHA